MLVTILPFFLVANVIIDDPQQQSQWMVYGPECTYDVLMNLSVANVIRDNDNVCLMIASELKCRPRGHDILSCHLENSHIKHPDSKEDRCTNDKAIRYNLQRFVDEEPFEIRFNPRGIENLVVHKTISRLRLAMIKNIVSQLNIGFDMQEHRDTFIVMENLNMGRCEVDVKIIRGGAEDDDDDDDDSSSSSEEDAADFVISFTSNDERTQSIQKKFQVEKLRDPQKCSRHMYFFGDHENYRRYYYNMTHSVSAIEISKDSFVSYTIWEGTMKRANNSRIMRVHQNLSLKLKRIDFARSPLPEIPDPAATSVFTFSNLQWIIPEEIEDNSN